MFTRKSNIFIALGAIFLVLVSFSAGVLAGKDSVYAKSNTGNTFFGLLLNEPETKAPENLENVDLTEFWEVWEIINKKYVTSEMPSDQEKVYGAINGLIASLGDPYSTFFPPTEAKMFEEDVSGSFEGVGMEVGLRDNILTIISPLKGTPADKAGVMAGDKIIQIDGTSTYDLTLNEAVDIIRGPEGTTVKLTIVREGEENTKDIDIVRGKIEIPVIETTLREDGVFVINLYSFYETAPKLFTRAINEFKQSGSNKLVLDLRNNPGGFLDASVDIAGNFLPAGKLVVRENFGEGKEENEYRTRGNFLLKDYNYTMVILMNQGSASASEILAGALSEQNAVPLIGEKSFGKGSVQELMKFDDGTSLKLTIARWLTPNGVSISEKGLTPNIDVPLTSEDFKEGKDPQLEKAVETLLAK